MPDGTSRRIAVGLAVSYEDQEQVDRCLRMVRRAFGVALERILLIDNGSRHGAWLGDLERVACVRSPRDEPIFVRMQRFVEAFLDETEADAFVKIDPDTVVLRWDGEFPDLAGHMLHYHPRHQSSRWSSMPEWWRRQNPEFLRPQYIHGIHGGYAWYSRDVCRGIRGMFTGYDCDWDPGLLRTGGLKEREGTRCMIGEEHMFGWYLKRSRVRMDKRHVNMTRRKYYTYRGEISDIPDPGELHVFHPVKTEAQFRELMIRVGWHDFEWRSLPGGG